MQKGQTQVLILAGIVLIIALAGGIFFLGRVTAPKPQPQNVVTSSPQPSPTLSPTTLPDPTTNWNSVKLKILSFKYPLDWEEIKPVTGGVTMIGPKDNENIWIGINHSPYTNPDETPEKLAQQALGKETPIGRKQLQIDSHQAIYQERHYPNSVRIEVYIGGVGGTHASFMEIRDLNQLESGRETFSQILSTFRFD